MKFYILALFTLVLAGCAAKELRPEAKRIPILTHEPHNCEYLGEVTGNQGGWQGEWTSAENLETGARNDMKNKAFEMGGNAIHMLGNRASQSGHWDKDGGHTKQTDVVYTAAVYKCPLKRATAVRKQPKVAHAQDELTL